MTSQPKTDTPSKLSVANLHVEKIKAAIKAAEDDGFTIDIDPERNRDWDLIGFDVDLNYKGGYIDTVHHVDWDERDL